MKRQNLLLVTNIASFLIENGSRFRVLLSMLPLLVLILVYALSSIAVSAILKINQPGYRVYWYPLLIATGGTLMVCYTVISNLAIRNMATSTASELETTPSVSWCYLEPMLGGIFALTLILARVLS